MTGHLTTKLAALSLIMTAPLWAILAWKWPISSDLIFYATSAKAFSAQFWAGELYPRWLMNTNFGFGSPVFLFYSPLAFYVISFFEFLAPIDPHGFGRIFIGIMLAIMLAGITSYRWLKQHFPVETAEKGALLYAGFPYLLLHIYGGFAVAQLWGVALFPLLLETADEMVKKNWRVIPKLALAYALLCFTHLPSTLTFAAVPCLYVMVFAPAGKRIVTIVSAILAALLGITLTMICLLPALSNKPYIAAEHFLDHNLVYANDFFDTYSLLGMVAVVLPLIVLFLELPKGKRMRLTTQVRFWLAIEAGLLFMAVPLSKPLWDALPPLQHLQFPFRFFLAMLPGTVFIALNWLPRAKSDYAYQMLFVIGLTCAAIYSEEIAFFPMESPVATILDNNLLARPEYQTLWMEEHDIDFRVSVPEPFRHMQPVTFISGSGSVFFAAQDARNIILHADIGSPEATIELRRFYFPGWVATPSNITISEHDSLLTLHLPQGIQDITLTLPWFAGEREGMIMGLGAMLILLGFFALSSLQELGSGRISER